MLTSIFVMFTLCIGNRLNPSAFSAIYTFVYTEIYRSFTTAVLGFAAFFVFSAVYRALRLKTLEAGAFTIAHALAVLNNAPVGAVISPFIPIIGTWINETIMSAGLRGFIICSSLGAVILGFRYLIGRSEAVLGGR